MPTSEVGPEQHRVTVAEKPVALTHGVSIGSQCRFAPGECCHQHQKRRAWQMKIRDHRVDHTKCEAGRNEDNRSAVESRKRAGDRRGFQCAYRRRTDGDDAAAARARALDRRNEIRRDLHALRMQRTCRLLFLAQRRKSSGTDVQGQVSKLYAHSRQGFEQVPIEVEAGSRCGNRTWAARIDRLITRLVIRLGGTRDIWRQRHFAVGFKQLLQVVIEFELEKQPAAADDGGRPRFETDLRA
jgi:hypothetical protein